MNRRAQVELSLETAIKLLLGAVIILFIIYMSYLIISLFVSGNRDYTAKRNLELLGQRIETAQEEGLEEASVILSMPKGYELRAFDASMAEYRFNSQNTKYTRLDDERGTGGESAVVVIKRPVDCGESCICAFKRNDALSLKVEGGYDRQGDLPWYFQEVACKDINSPSVQGVLPTKLAEEGPVNVAISLRNQRITFAAQDVRPS